MGIRQTINEKPAISVGVTAGVIVLALIFIIFQLVGGKTPPAARPTKAWFSDDDGKTWFADDVNKYPPFKDNNGKTAVRAFVYQCTGQPFCLYLQRYTPQGKERLEKSKSPIPSRALGGQLMNMTEVKKPGDPVWTRGNPRNPTAYMKVVTPVCPDGSTNNIHVVPVPAE